ncbi:MAG: CocE/NonD family hydrolase C-terminal non-catalytic domain-containing protein, partial [Bdellovibrionia bacterium]
QANWFVRLTDIAPDGTSTLITGAGMNGAHRDSATEPKAIPKNEVFTLQFDLHFTSWVVPEGHRIRVAVSNSLWPMIFPSPDLMTTSLYSGIHTPSIISIPIVPVKPESIPKFYPPNDTNQLPDVDSRGGHWPEEWFIQRDHRNVSTRATWKGGDETQFPWGLIKNYEEISYFAQDHRTDTSSVKGYSETKIFLPNRSLKWEGHLKFTGDRTSFYFQYTRQLFEDGKLIRKKTWDEVIPRDHQ